MVDALIATKLNQLRYLSINQEKLCANFYKGIASIIGDMQNHELQIYNLE